MPRRAAARDLCRQMPDNIARTPRRCILPIGLLFAGTLWSSNAAYLYLSVSFIQMLKVWRMSCCARHMQRQLGQCS